MRYSSTLQVLCIVPPEPEHSASIAATLDKLVHSIGIMLRLYKHLIDRDSDRVNNYQVFLLFIQQGNGV
jgi:hypothetical protein